jgi:hypothetical protein
VCWHDSAAAGPITAMRKPTANRMACNNAAIRNTPTILQARMA